MPLRCKCGTVLRPQDVRAARLRCPFCGQLYRVARSVDGPPRLVPLREPERSAAEPQQVKKKRRWKLFKARARPTRRRRRRTVISPGAVLLVLVVLGAGAVFVVYAVPWLRSFMAERAIRRAFGYVQQGALAQGRAELALLVGRVPGQFEALLNLRIAQAEMERAARPLPPGAYDESGRLRVDLPDARPTDQEVVRGAVGVRVRLERFVQYRGHDEAVFKVVVVNGGSEPLLLHRRYFYLLSGGRMVPPARGVADTLTGVTVQPGAEVEGTIEFWEAGDFFVYNDGLNYAKVDVSGAFDDYIRNPAAIPAVRR